MTYRLTITRTNGEAREIDYESRRAAYTHFRSVALSPNVNCVVLEKIDADITERLARCDIIAQPA